MENIEGIAGLTVERVDNRRVVKYNGVECPLIKRDEILCEQDTSYNGCVMDSTETYTTPVGVVKRTYWARGAGLERTGVDWCIVPVTEIEAAQLRFVAASLELANTRKALEMVVTA